MSDVIEAYDLIAYLAGKDVRVRKATGAEVVANCFFCGESKRAGKLYLNADSWLYDCKVCGERGNRRTLLRFFGDEDNVSYTPGTDPYLRRTLLDEAATLGHEMLLGNEKQLAYLLARGLGPDTIISARLGYVPRGFSLARSLPTFVAGKAKIADLIHAGVLTAGGGTDFFADSLLIPYVSHGHVVQIREKKPDGKYRTCGGDAVRLFGEDSLRGADEVIVTEGEFDGLILKQTLSEHRDARFRAMAVVSLPGVEAWPSDFPECLDGLKRVYIGVDPDVPGRAGAVKLKSALGSRARVIELPRDLPKCDWTEYLRERSPEHPHGGHGAKDVGTLVAEADLAGKRMFTVSDAAAKWERNRVEKPGIKLGWATLDAVIRPGLKPGQVMIPLAKTGAGKTVFLSNVVHNVRSHRTLFVSLELTAAEVYEQLHRIHHFHFPDVRREQMAQDYARLRIVDQNRLGRGDLSDLIHEYAEDEGDMPELVMIDYLGYYARGFRSGMSAYERISDAIMDVKALAKEHDVAVITPHQVNRGAEDGMPLEADDARDSGVIEETGDFVMGMFRPALMRRQDGTVEDEVNGAFNLQLLKSRHGGKGRVFNLRFSTLSLVIVDALDRVNAVRVEQENAEARRGTHYEEYRRATSARQLKVVG